MKDILEEIREMNNRDRQKEEEKYYKKLCDQYNEALTCMGLDYEDSDPLLVSNMMKELTSRRVTGRILSVFHELSVYREIGTTDKCKKAMEEQNSKWILCIERMPEEHDSMFANLKGTNKWNDAMFEKISDNVNVTVEFENGQRKTMTLHTVDGKWKQDSIVKFDVVAWQPLPEPFLF